MKIDLEHLHHWMQAIRQSNNPMRTMDAFWSGQLKSKEWLIDKLTPLIPIKHEPVTIDIHGGWVGTLASMLFQSYIPIKSIQNIDIDPHTMHTSIEMNKIEEIQGRYKHITQDMCTFNSIADVIINTSTEHITQYEYDMWLEQLPNNSLLVLQSNNYVIPEHKRISHSIEEFIEQSHIDVVASYSLELPLYTRYMLIGRKHVSQ